MSQRELVSFVKRHDDTEDRWEKRVSLFDIEQVNAESVERYIEKGHAAKRIEFQYSDKESALNKLQLTDGKRLLNAGMVLSCSSMYAELQMAVFAGTERLTFLDIKRN